MTRGIGLPSPLLVLLVLLVAVDAAVVAGMVTSGSDFGPYNGGWNGGTELQRQLRQSGSTPSVTTTTAAYARREPRSSAAIVLAPRGSYADSEARDVEAFVRRGGLLVVAAEGERANEFLAAIGVSARLSNATLVDPQSNYRAPDLPVATNVSDHPLVAGVDSVTLNHGTAVVPNEATVLARTSGAAYEDFDENRELNASELLDDYPVATVEDLGAGSVVVLGDASVFTNAMLERDGNRALLRSLVAQRTDVILDYSHGPGLPPLSFARLAVQRSPLLQALVGLTGLVTVVVISRRDRVREFLGRDRDDDADVDLDADDIAERLAERNDWDPERTRRVTQAILRDRGIEGGDD